jgi:hypothetical protein
MSDERPLETGWLDDTPFEDSVSRSFLANQAELNERFVECGGGRFRRDADLVCADGENPVPYMNQAVALRPPDDDLLARLHDFYAASTAGATFLSAWPTPDLGPAGWELMGHPMLVARGPWDGADRGPAAGVEVRDVRDLDGVGDFERVLAEGYPMPTAAGLPPGSVYPPGLLDRGVVLRVGALDGTPVAVGAAYAAHGVVNLCAAATLPAARRRGVWEALVRSRMAVAPDLPAVAYTSDDSRPGFVRLGFLPLFRLSLWWKPPRT